MILKVPLDFEVYVDVSLFSNAKGVLPGSIVMMSWREGRVPVFDVLVRGSGLFCDLPLSAFTFDPQGSRGSFNLVPQRSLDHYPETTWVGSYPCYEGKEFSVFGRSGRLNFIHTKYLFSFELDRNNDLYHFLRVGDHIGMFANQYVLMGLHKKRPRWHALLQDYSKVLT